MNRTVSSILIPVLLVSQSLFSVPHSHAGSSIVVPDGHAARPHVHLHGAAHHHHGHQHGREETPSSTGEQLPDHDSDVVFAGDDQLLHDARGAKVAKAELTAACVMGHDATANAALQRVVRQFEMPPGLRSKCTLCLPFFPIRC